MKKNQANLCVCKWEGENEYKGKLIITLCAIIFGNSRDQAEVGCDPKGRPVLSR